MEPCGIHFAEEVPLMRRKFVPLCNQFIQAFEIDPAHLAHLETPDTQQQSRREARIVEFQPVALPIHASRKHEDEVHPLRWIV